MIATQAFNGLISLYQIRDLAIYVVAKKSFAESIVVILIRTTHKCRALKTLI